jgi:hypothetical protein
MGDDSAGDWSFSSTAASSFSSAAGFLVDRP